MTERTKTLLALLSVPLAMILALAAGVGLMACFAADLIQGGE